MGRFPKRSPFNDELRDRLLEKAWAILANGQATIGALRSPVVSSKLFLGISWGEFLKPNFRGFQYTVLCGLTEDLVRPRSNIYDPFFTYCSYRGPGLWVEK